MLKILKSAVATLFLAATLLAQTPIIQDGRFHGRRAWVTSNGLKSVCAQDSVTESFRVSALNIRR